MSTAKVSFNDQYVRLVIATSLILASVFYAVLLDDLAAYSDRYTLFFRWTIPLTQLAIASYIILSARPKRSTITRR